MKGKIKNKDTSKHYCVQFFVFMQQGKRRSNEVKYYTEKREKIRSLCCCSLLERLKCVKLKNKCKKKIKILAGCLWLWRGRFHQEIGADS